jgi:hypothetical protein
LTDLAYAASGTGACSDKRLRERETYEHRGIFSPTRFPAASSSFRRTADAVGGSLEPVYAGWVDVTFAVSGDLLTLPERQATILAEKLRLFAAGQFRADVRKLEERGTNRGWLAGTREAADLIEMALVDERSGPVLMVRGDVAEAVFQVLRLSHLDPSGREGAAGLVEALEALSKPGG